MGLSVLPRRSRIGTTGWALASDGNLYGTCGLGGAHSQGTADKSTTGGTVNNLHDFTGTEGGAQCGALMQASDSNFYSGGSGGAANSKGSFIKMTTGGTVTKLHDFGGKVGQLNVVPFYDPASRRVNLQTWWGPVTYVYDALGRMTGLIDPGYPAIGLTGGRTSWTYDQRSLVSRQDNPNGTYATFLYDGNGQTQQVRHAKVGAGEIAHAFYSRDAVGNPLSKHIPAGLVNYTVDALDQLLSENHPTSGLTQWSFDPANRRLTQQTPSALTNYVHDPADQLTSATTSGQTTAYTHDSAGNVTRVAPPSGAPTSYLWDAVNRLAGVVRPSGVSLTYTYRFDDLWHGRQSPSGTDGPLWEGEDVLQWCRTQAGAGPAQMFGMGANLGRSLGQQNGGAGLSRQYHLDEQGSVLAVTDGNGTVLTSYQTDAWGNVLSGSLADNPLDYGGGQGYWRDPDSGLLYVRARWLDPANGQWLSPDPVEGEPRYAYAYNSPTVFTDPSGMQGSINDPWIRENLGHLQWAGVAPGQPGAAPAIWRDLKDLWLRGIHLDDIYRKGPKSQDHDLLFVWATLNYVVEVHREGIYRIGGDIRAGARMQEFYRAHPVPAPTGWMPGIGEAAPNYGLYMEIKDRRASGLGYPVQAYRHYHDNWDDGNAATKKALAVTLIGPYLDLFRESAKRNHIPVWLLETIVLAEILDTYYTKSAQPKDAFEDAWPWLKMAVYGSEASIGMAQLQANRAVEHQLVDVQPIVSSAWQGPYLPRPGLMHTDYGPVHEALLRPRFAIEAAAREIAFEIRALKQAPRNSAWRQYALNYTIPAKTAPRTRASYERMWMRNVPTMGRMDVSTQYVEGLPSEHDESFTPTAKSGEEYLVFIVQAVYNSPEIVTPDKVISDSWKNAIRMGRFSMEVYQDLLKMNFFR